jgi:SET domain-containing protein
MSIYISAVEGKGRGVFSNATIKKGQVFEVAPVVILSRKEEKHIIKTRLAHYYYSWGKRLLWGQCIVLGYGSLYNHSYKPNADYRSDVKNKNMIYFAKKQILPGQEITIDYGVRLWFKAN